MDASLEELVINIERTCETRRASKFFRPKIVGAERRESANVGLEHNRQFHLVDGRLDIVHADVFFGQRDMRFTRIQLESGTIYVLMGARQLIEFCNLRKL